MEPNVHFLGDLTVALTAAVIGGWIARLFGLDSIVGYLVAGMAIGPFTPGYVAERETLANLAELGLIFLLFSIGLRFSFRELVAAGAVPIAAGLAAMGALVAAFWAAAVAFHFQHPWTLALAAVVSSTAIGVALLRQWGMEERRSGQFVIALLIVQDLVAVALLVVTSAPNTALNATGILAPMVMAIGFVAIALVAGATVLHVLVVRVLQRMPTEALFGAFAALALIAASLAHLAGLPFDFGAFVAGAVISEAAASRMVHSIVAPFQALFVALFFVSIGTLLDPRQTANEWLPILAIGSAFLLVRFAAWAAIGRLGGFPARTAILIGVAMVPLGEFNIVLGNAAFSASRLDETERILLLGLTFSSILVATIGAPAFGRLRSKAERENIEVEGHVAAAAEVVVIGYGRVGRTVAIALERSEIPFAVIERDRALVAVARARGIETVLGDGSDPRALDAAVTLATRVIVATTPETGTNAAVARRYGARPETLVIARASHTDDIAGLLRGGAVRALVPEIEGALAFAAAALRGLDVSDERIAREIAVQRKEMELDTDQTSAATAAP
jgi:CPA2 family monovalent cation:H+ antiporter-2